MTTSVGTPTLRRGAAVRQPAASCHRFATPRTSGRGRHLRRDHSPPLGHVRLDRARPARPGVVRPRAGFRGRGPRGSVAPNDLRVVCYEGADGSRPVRPTFRDRRRCSSTRDPPRPTRADRMTAARDLALDTMQLEQDGRVLTARFTNPPLTFMTTVFI